MSSDQLILTAHFCSFAVVVVQACYIWKLQDEIKRLESQRSALADLGQMYRESMTNRGQRLVDQMSADEIAELRSSVDQQSATSEATLEGYKDAMRQLIGSQKSPSSVSAINAQQRQAEKEITDCDLVDV